MNRSKTAVKYYILIAAILAFLFFSGDFGLIDAQKTAIVMVVGVDREEDTFIITSQIAVPQASKQGKQTETVQLVSRGKTVAAAFEEINDKTGWYPKLVFCHLILLGEKTTEQNVFDVLDFFLLDEYTSDNCLVAVCEGLASDMLNHTALVDPSGSVAIQRVISTHAQRVGTAMPSTLREFAIGYYGNGKSGFLPIVKTKPQQEKIGQSTSNKQGSSGSQGGNQEQGSSGGQGGNQEQGSPSGQAPSGSDMKSNDKPVFSAGETALFYKGKKVGEFTREETFAFNAVKHDIQLATYTLDGENESCSLTIKHNQKKLKVSAKAPERPILNIQVTMSAGLLDCSSSSVIENATDAGAVPAGVFPLAEKRLAEQITSAFEKCKESGCDLFGVGDSLQKYNPSAYDKIKDYALQNTHLQLDVRFRNIR